MRERIWFPPQRRYLNITSPRSVKSDFFPNPSYQACDSLYLDNGFDNEQASELMRGAVGIAQQAISKAGKDNKREIGLSLGPFGATLSPGQE